MSTHTLKCGKEFFPDILSGAKTFEMRRNDRGFKIGDRLMLCEYDIATLQFTERACEVEVTSYLDDHDNTIGRRGLAPGYCVMSIKLVLA